MKSLLLLTLTAVTAFAQATSESEKRKTLNVTLSAEQWLDLIDAMKLEYERAVAARENFDN